MKKNLKKAGAVLLATSLVIQAAGCADINLGKSSDDASSKDSAESETSSNAQEASTKDATTAATTSSNTTTVSVESLERTNMLNGLFSEETVEYTVKADGLVPESDLSNVSFRGLNGNEEFNTIFIRNHKSVSHDFTPTSIGATIVGDSSGTIHFLVDHLQGRWYYPCVYTWFLHRQQW